MDRAQKRKKGKEPATSSSSTYDSHRFRSRYHENHFQIWVSKKAIIPEVRFALEPHEYPEIHEEIQRRGWELLCDPPQTVGLMLTQEFFANAFRRENEIEAGEFLFTSYVRGYTIDYSPRHIRRILKLRRNQGSEMSYELRMESDMRLDEVMMDICLPDSEWKLDRRGNRNQLSRADLTPLAMGWLDFIQHSIIPTSNRTEVTVDRAVLIHSILKGEQVKVENIIAQNINDIAQSGDARTRLAFPSIIQRLCHAAGAHVENDIPIPRERPINASIMSRLRGRRARLGAPILPVHAQAQPASPAQHPTTSAQHPSPPPAQQEPSSSGQQQNPGMTVDELYQKFRAFEINVDHRMNYLCTAMHVAHRGVVPPFHSLDPLWVQSRMDMENRDREEQARRGNREETPDGDVRTEDEDEDEDDD